MAGFLCRTQVGCTRLIAFGIALLAGVGILTMGRSSSMPSDTSVFDSVSAEELARAYAADQIGADAAYRGQDLAVTGTILSVTQLFPGSALVILTGDENLNVGCFPGAWWNYRDHSGPITMFGVGEGLKYSMGVVDGVVSLSHCEVVRPGEPTPVGRPSHKPTP